MNNKNLVRYCGIYVALLLVVACAGLTPPEIKAAENGNVIACNTLAAYVSPTVPASLGAEACIGEENAFDSEIVKFALPDGGGVVPAAVKTAAAGRSVVRNASGRMLGTIKR